MSNEEAVPRPRPQLLVPPSRRAGAILGWLLPALGVACVIVSLKMGNSAESAWRAAQALPVGSVSAYAIYIAAEAAYHEGTLRAYLLAIAGGLSMFTVPGLLYATRPSLIGGPIGRLLRWAHAHVISRHPHGKQPLSFSIKVLDGHCQVLVGQPSVWQPSSSRSSDSPQ